MLPVTVKQLGTMKSQYVINLKILFYSLLMQSNMQVTKLIFSHFPHRSTVGIVSRFSTVRRVTGCFGPIPVRTPVRFGPIPFQSGRFGPILEVGRFGSILVGRFGPLYFI